MQTYESQEHFPQAQKVLDWAHLCRVIHLVSARFVPVIPLFSALGASSSMTGCTPIFSMDRSMRLTPNFGFILVNFWETCYLLPRKHDARWQRMPTTPLCHYWRDSWILNWILCIKF